MEDKLYLTESSGKRRSALLVECNNCGIEFLKRKDSALKDSKHYCSSVCHNDSQKEAVMLDGEKYCRKCKCYKNIKEFYKRSETGTPRATCKSCADAKRQSKNKIGIRQKLNIDVQLKSMLKRSYGLDLDEYKSMVIKQNNLCAICLKEETLMRHGVVNRLCVDHCHSTSKIRGLLCHRCNIALGMFGDDVVILTNAIKYLEINDEN